jgi:hypothetical protein
MGERKMAKEKEKKKKKYSYGKCVSQKVEVEKREEHDLGGINSLLREICHRRASRRSL